MAYRGEKGIRALVEEVILHPETLNAELIAWLCSDEAKQSHQFFWWLGCLDLDRNGYQSSNSLGTQQSGAEAFSAYFGGRTTASNPTAVMNRSAELVDARQVSAEALILAYRHLPANSKIVSQVINLITEKRVSPAFVEVVSEV